jgi:hypothetical protein
VAFEDRNRGGRDTDGDAVEWPASERLLARNYEKLRDGAVRGARTRLSHIEGEFSDEALEWHYRAAWARLYPRLTGAETSAELEADLTRLMVDGMAGAWAHQATDAVRRSVGHFDLSTAARSDA